MSIIEDKVDITALARIMIDIIRINRKKNGIFILQDDPDIVELALLTVITCCDVNLPVGASMALNMATGISFGADKIVLEERLIDMLRKQMDE